MGRESFIEDNFSWLSELKLKTSYGVLGNQNISNYPYQDTYNLGSNYNYPFGGEIYSGIQRTTVRGPWRNYRPAAQWGPHRGGPLSISRPHTAHNLRIYYR